MSKQVEISEAKLYVGTYHKYNCGSIAGAWLKLADYSSLEEFTAACLELHSDEEDPELMFQDYENLPRSMYSESSIPSKYWEIAEAIEDINQEAFYEFLDWTGYDIESDDITDLVSKFEDSYQGEFNSELDFTYDLVDQLGYIDQMPESLRYYFDYEKFARDLFMGDYYYSDGHVFNCHY